MKFPRGGNCIAKVSWGDDILRLRWKRYYIVLHDIFILLLMTRLFIYFENLVMLKMDWWTKVGQIRVFLSSLTLPPTGITPLRSWLPKKMKTYSLTRCKFPRFPLSGTVWNSFLFPTRIQGMCRENWLCHRIHLDYEATALPIHPLLNVGMAASFSFHSNPALVPTTLWTARIIPWLQNLTNTSLFVLIFIICHIFGYYPSWFLGSFSCLL